MANQTVTTVVNYDDASIGGLLNGETLTIDGGSVTVDSDVRWNQQAAVLGAVTLSSSLGGSFLIDGTQVWELPFDASTGNVPTQSALGSNNVNGTGGASGELLRVWADGELEPRAAGGAMPAAGWIKLRSKIGTFADNEVVTLPGGATITLTSPGKRSWINVVGREAQTLTIPRLGIFEVEGDWYEIGTTDGTDNQEVQLPFRDECPAIQIEAGVGTGEYEWWTNGAGRWLGNIAPDAQTVSNATATTNNITGPSGALTGGQFSHGTRLRETTSNTPHGTGAAFAANSANASLNLKYRVWLKKETRRYMHVQAHAGSNRYGVLVDLDTGTSAGTNTVGSPTGTSNTITALTDGWYEIELTLDNNALANVGGINIYLASTSTPTYDANGLPTYSGSTAQGGYYAEPQIIVPTSTIDTDVRGKVFYSDATTGKVILARRGGGLDAGAKPDSGLRIRIPNVILSSANAVDYARNTQNPTLATRYDLTTTAAGSVTIKYALCNWFTAASNCFSVNMHDSAFAAQISFTNVANEIDLQRIAVGLSRSNQVSAASFTGCYTGGIIEDSVFARFLGSAAAVFFSVCNNFEINRCTTITYSSSIARNTRSNAGYGYNIADTNNLIFTDCVMIGGAITANAGNNTRAVDTKYANDALGSTQNVTSQYAFALVRTSGFDLDGFSNISGITNTHPFAGIISTNTSCQDIDIRNVGTATTPYNAGTANAMGLFAAFLGTTTNVVMLRLYADNMRTAAISTVNTIQNLRMYNVWADGADSQVMLAVDAVAQGCRWTNPSTGQSAVYGTHWEDAFVSTTAGRLTIAGNEPIDSTADQCAFTLGTGAGFTSAGNVSMPNLSDTVTWTMPYYALGHTSIAATASGWAVIGTAVQNLEFEYQIDTGTGFSSWKHLVNQARQFADGTAGTNTVTLAAADLSAMIRQPQIGDYVQSGSERLPNGTTVTNIASGVITLSNNFVTTLDANELLFFWDDIAVEVIDPGDGYKLKVRAVVNTADPINLLSFLRIPFDTDSVSQQLQYPLPVAQNTATVTNIFAGSRIQIYNLTTDTEVANEVVSGTEFEYLYDEGTDFSDGDVIRVRLARCTGSTASIGYEGLAIAGPAGWSLLAQQTNDDVYQTNGIDGTTVSEFAFDYPNVEVDIDDPDGTTSITRLYAWWANERATEDGIRELIGGLVAEDAANYKIITDRVDLKLDNTSASGVQFTGDLRLYRDDGAAPVVNSTTGGGSITLYAGKVYTVETGTSGLTTSEAATLAKIDTLTENVSGLRFTAKALEEAPAGGGSGTDWTSAEREQIRHRLGIDGTATAPSTGTPSLATPASVRTELATELARLDVSIGSRLASASYTAPANADIAAIKAKTDNLPASPAATGDIPSAATNASAVRSELTTELGRIDAAVSSRLATSGYTAPANADIAAIKAKTDNLPSDPADQSAVEAAIAAIPAAPSSAANAAAVRTNLATELARIDVTVGSRLAAASYTAPANADISAIKAKTDNLPNDPADQSAVESAISAIPAAPTAEANADAVRTELAVELGRIDAATSTRATPADVLAQTTDALDDFNTATSADIDAVKINTDLIPGTL